MQVRRRMLQTRHHLLRAYIVRHLWGPSSALSHNHWPQSCQVCSFCCPAVGSCCHSKLEISFCGLLFCFAVVGCSGRIVKETDRLIEGGSSHHSFVKGSGAESFQHRIGTRVGTVLAHRLMTSTASLLSQSLSHSIIPALLHTVSHSPLQDYYCYYCAKHKTYCSYCQYAPAQLYYAVYYGEYYSHYYTNFYVRYYTQLMQP